LAASYASADQLKDGGHRITYNVMTCGDAVEQYTRNACSTSKQVEDLLCQILDEVVNKTAHELPVARIMRFDMRLTKKASPRT